MGRYAPKCPQEVIAELYRLAIDEEISVSEARAEIAGRLRVEIVESTAYSYIQRERVRRSMKGSPLPEESGEALDALGRRVIGTPDAEVRRIQRAAKHGTKPLDLDRALTVARAIKELRAGLGPQGRSKPGQDESEQKDDSRANGEPYSFVADLLADLEATCESRPGNIDERGEGARLSNRQPPLIDHDAQAQLQAYLDRRTGQP